SFCAQWPPHGQEDLVTWEADEVSSGCCQSLRVDRRARHRARKLQRALPDVLVRSGERLLASGFREVQGGQSREFLTSPASCTIDQAPHGEPTERLGRSPTWSQLVSTCEVE